METGLEELSGVIEGQDLAGEADVVVCCGGAAFELRELGMGTERTLSRE